MYNHIFRYFDIIKINSKVKNIIATEVAKGYCLSNISKIVKNIKQAINKKALEDKKKVYLNLKKIHNVSALQKYQNTDICTIRARI